MSAIEWTDHTVNVQIGCSRVSPGCEHCYAERQAQSMAHGAYGKAQQARYLPVVDGRGRWSREVVLDQAMLDRGPRHPKRKRDGNGWRSPRVFLGSMTDHFHEQVTPEMFLRVMRYMASRPETIWQVVTKRPERARALLDHANEDRGDWGPWPRIHLLATVEDQQCADERITHLLHAAPHVELVGLSVEPLLERVDLRLQDRDGRIEWVIVGGESGPGSRPCSVEWIRDVVTQCRAAEVPCFVKQLGANPSAPVDGVGWPLFKEVKHPKGGDWSEWPPDLRVREFPR